MAEITPKIGHASLQGVSWIVALAVPSAMILAGSMGANDVGNAFGTAVGSRVMTLRQASLIAAIFEFLGAALLCHKVSKTLASGIVDPARFSAIPALFILGNWSALVGSLCWLVLATVLCLPVSATQSITGALLGYALVELGSEALTKQYKELVKILISWVASPLVAGRLMAGGSVEALRREAKPARGKGYGAGILCGTCRNRD
jgi:PiT family inorganic phosphate transporter